MKLTNAQRDMDKIIYVLLCVATFGTVLLIRIVITEAVRQALDYPKE